MTRQGRLIGEPPTEAQLGTASRTTRRGALRACAATLLLTAAGCTVRPQPLTDEEMQVQATADRDRLRTWQAPPATPISVEEAQARALRYNLDARLAAHEQAVQNRQVALAPFDMLPRVTASAGYVTRDRENITTSFSRNTGQTSSDTFIGVERNRALADLGFSWNILDFGASYFAARQQADRALIAAERRRKIVHTLFTEVEATYWQALAAQRTMPRLDGTIRQTRIALRNVQRLEQARALPPADSLRMQRELLEIVRQLEAIASDLAITRARLAGLMGLPPGTPYLLAEATEETTAAALPALDALEEMALLRRPELREEAYARRITADEARRALLRLLPGISLTASVNYDSNTYLVYNNWAEAGLRLAADLVRLASLPQTMELNAANAELAETRRLAVAMAVLAQLHIATEQHQRALAQHARATEIDNVERRLARLAAQRHEQEAGSELDRARDVANALLAELRRHRSYADLRAARTAVAASIGLDLLPAEVDGDDIASLASAISATRRDWHGGHINLASAP